MVLARRCKRNERSQFLSRSPRRDCRACEIGTVAEVGSDSCCDERSRGIDHYNVAWWPRLTGENSPNQRRVFGCRPTANRVVRRALHSELFRSYGKAPDRAILDLCDERFSRQRYLVEPSPAVDHKRMLYTEFRKRGSHQ